jgi:hypothetical protein
MTDFLGQNSGICVEKNVDYFREFPAEFQNSPLVKRDSFLICGATPYLSTDILELFWPPTVH